jgi:hypothetical protein
MSPAERSEKTLAIAKRALNRAILVSPDAMIGYETYLRDLGAGRGEEFARSQENARARTTYQQQLSLRDREIADMSDRREYDPERGHHA